MSTEGRSSLNREGEAEGEGGQEGGHEGGKEEEAVISYTVSTEGRSSRLGCFDSRDKYLKRES